MRNDSIATLSENDLLEASSLQPTSGVAGALSTNDSWDSVLLSEAKLLSDWTGTSPALVHSTKGTAALANGTIQVNRSQLDSLFSGFSGEKYRTAVFFVLAHEFGHLCQFQHFGVKDTFSRPRITIEGHADMLSGAWLGLRLVQGQERDPSDLLEAALKLKANTTMYPSAYQRSLLVSEAMGYSVTLTYLLEPQIKEVDYISLNKGISKEDVESLYDISERRLLEIPRQAP